MVWVLLVFWTGPQHQLSVMRTDFDSPAACETSRAEMMRIMGPTPSADALTVRVETAVCLYAIKPTK